MGTRRPLLLAGRPDPRQCGRGRARRAQGARDDRDLAVPRHRGRFGHVDRVAVADLEIAGHEHAVGRGQVQHVDETLVPHEPGLVQDALGHFHGFVAEHEDAGRIGARGIQPADLRQSLDRGQFAPVEGDQSLVAGRAQHGIAALIGLDIDPVAAAHGDVQLGVIEQVVQPDPVGDRPARDGDHRGLRGDVDAARRGQHGRQAAVGTGDRIDPLRAHGPDHADAGPVAAGAADIDLRVGRLLVKLVGDGGAQVLGRAAGGAHAPREGDVDEALGIDLQLGQLRARRLGRGEQPLGHVFIDGDRNGVAGADRVAAQ
eukprot:m.15134 g.15134  ORF g.15134 m.15134 type:complete len:315 (-) comp7792_c0_seq1:280-1224(-)